MDVGTLEALLIFALAATPGAIVSEIVTFGRPPLRERNRVRSLAFYLVMSAAAWAVAVVVFAAGDDLIVLIDARAGEAADYVAAAGRLFAQLLVAALIAGALLRIGAGLALRAAQSLYEKVRHSERWWLQPFRRALGDLVSLAFAWDSLLARVRHSQRPQLVHVRLRDGGDVYGVFAGGGRADWRESGRGLVLDAEFVESGDQLVRVSGSRGTYVSPDAAATVSFAAFPEETTEPGIETRRPSGD